MFQDEKLPFIHLLADEPLRMPVNSVLCLPRYVTGQSDILIFNLFAAIATVFQNYGWERATKIVSPSIWAPGWTKEQIYKFAESPMPGQVKPEIKSGQVLIEHVFPGFGSKTDPNYTHRRESSIVHFTGRLVDLKDDRYGLDLGAQDGGALDLQSLSKVTSTARTRLLILQVLAPEDFTPAISLGHELVKAGGPAVLVVSADEIDEIANGFTNMYFNLCHNQPIPDMLKYAWSLDGGAQVRLIYGEGGEDLLRFGSYFEEVRHKYDQIQAEADRQFLSLSDIEDRVGKTLHAEQRKSFEQEVMAARLVLEEVAPELKMAVEQLKRADELIWMHEGEGVVPLSMSSENIERAGRAIAALGEEFADLRAELEEEMSHAPRVLNANFADPDLGKVLGLKDGLVEGREYYLLVDIGPRWNKIASAVVGEDLFPDEALPADKDGYVVEVILVSEDFSPHLSSAQMWVPRGTGRSYPIVNGQHAEESGPVALKVSAPYLPDGFDGQSLLAHARLCLYYENNLLQSAVVAAGVTATDGVLLEINNKIEVDYVLTGGFQDVEAIFAKREVKLDIEAGSEGIPVTLNLALNDDGAGGHRIIVKGRHDPLVDTSDTSPNVCPPYGWSPYDPIAGGDLLENARQMLLNCFFQKHTQAGDQFGKLVMDGQGQPVFGLQPDNSKNLTQFKIDLLLLAELGYDLWATAFDQVKIDHSLCILVEWRRNFRSIIANSTLIQVSRTGPAQYVYPWTMVYEYPLNKAERPKWQMCKILDEEWSPQGIRQGLEMERKICKYHQEDWHRKNIICPYGFWGLKHIIEEPPSLPFGDRASLDNAAKEILVGKEIDISSAVTEDVNLDSAKIKKHIDNLGKIPGVILTLAKPKQDWDGLQPLLRSPEVVYLLCHGEYDDLAKEAYLSIGPRNADSSHRIYPKGTLASWIDDEVDGPDIGLWKRQRPLIFINGCHTADLRPGQIVSFASTFAGVGASGVLGTEVSVTLSVAIEVAESLIGKLSSNEHITLGQALRQIRWELANKGNLLGLAYTLYGLADIHIKRDVT
jgi:hypothetical protein